MEYIKHFIYWLFKTKGSGLLPLQEDKRDYQVKELGIGWFGYKPKHDKHIIETLSVKQQDPLNTCQWCATTVAKEVDEGKKLSCRSIVVKAKELGLLSGNGWSSLRSGQEVLRKWGILTEATCPDTGHNNWTTYSSFNVNKYNEEAAKHKIKSYWMVRNIEEVYELLDKGKVIVTGMDWYSGFNMGGGFKAPWIIREAVGWVVGGHAFVVKGYDRTSGEFLMVEQNSYGSAWGDKGNFWVTESYMINNAFLKYGAFVNLDESSVEEPWVAEAKKLYERVKALRPYIMRVEGLGEMYVFTAEGLNYIGVNIGDKTLKVEFNKYLLDKNVFTPVSEKDFDLISKYLRLQGLKVGKPENNK